MLHLACDFVGYYTCLSLRFFRGDDIFRTVWGLTSVRITVDPPRSGPKELQHQLWEIFVSYIIPYIGVPFTQHVCRDFAGKRFQHFEREKGFINLIINR